MPDFDFESMLVDCCEEVVDRVLSMFARKVLNLRLCSKYSILEGWEAEVHLQVTHALAVEAVGTRG